MAETDILTTTLENIQRQLDAIREEQRQERVEIRGEIQNISRKVDDIMNSVGNTNERVARQEQHTEQIDKHLTARDTTMAEFDRQLTENRLRIQSLEQAKETTKENVSVAGQWAQAIMPVVWKAAIAIGALVAAVGYIIEVIKK